jgi:hypothetical protein
VQHRHFQFGITGTNSVNVVAMLDGALDWAEALSPKAESRKAKEGAMSYIN